MTEKLYTIGARRSCEGDFYRFDHIANLEALRRYDKYAADGIKRAESLIEAIRQYRLDLYTHCRALESVGSHPELSLTRQRSYPAGKVTYTVELRRVYTDGKLQTTSEFHRTFPGTERKKASALFEQMQKERPGIKCIVDTARKGWEK